MGKQQEQREIFKYGRPHGSRVIIKADEALAVSPGGIIIPDMAKERPQFGTVLAVGPLVTEDIKEGDRIVYGKHAGTPLIIQDITYYIMQEREIFMSLDQEEMDKLILNVAPPLETAKKTELTATMDKNNYKVGESIKLLICLDGVEFGASIFILIYKGKKILSEIRESTYEHNKELLIPVTADMLPEIRIQITTGENIDKSSTSMKIEKEKSFNIEVHN